MSLESVTNACYTVDTGVINTCSDGNMVLGSPESNVAPGMHRQSSYIVSKLDSPVFRVLSSNRHVVGPLGEGLKRRSYIEPVSKRDET